MNMAYLELVDVADEDVTYDQAVSFLETLQDSVMAGLCVGLYPGMTRTVDSNIGYVHIVRHNFDGIANQTLTTSCGDTCPASVVNVSSSVSVGRNGVGPFLLKSSICFQTRQWLHVEPLIVDTVVMIRLSYKTFSQDSLFHWE